MSDLNSILYASRPGRWALALPGILFLFIMAPAVAVAGSVDSDSRILPSCSSLNRGFKYVSIPAAPAIHGLGGVRNAALAWNRPAAISPIMGNWVSQALNKFETWLRDRTHMIQFCAIGMVLGLVIIWWRKT
jgi:hypothetical protein